MFRLRSILLVLAFVLTNISYVGAAQDISLDNFLEKLEKTHPFFTRVNLSKDVAVAQRDAFLGKADVNFKTDLSHEFTEAVSVDTFSAPMQNKTTATIGASKEVWTTGGTFSAEAQTIYSDSKSSAYTEYYGVPNNYAYNQFALSYAQPLLKNRGGKVSRYYYDNQDFEVAIVALQQVENIENFKKQQAFDFLNLLTTVKQGTVYKKRLDLSEDELKRTKEKYESNLIDKVDLIRAKDSVRISKQNLKMSDLQEKSKRKQLSILVQDEALLLDLPVEEKLEVGFIEESMHEKIKEGLKENSRVLLIAALRTEKLKHSKRKYEDDVKGDLSLYTKYVLKDSDDTFSKAGNFGKQDAQVGVYYRLPWQNREARNKINEFDLKIKQSEASEQETYLDLLSKIDAAYIQVKDMEEVLALNLEQIDSAKEKTREELKLYNQGRTQYTFVINSQDNEQNAALNYINNLIKYKQLVITYLELVDKF